MKGLVAILGLVAVQAGAQDIPRSSIGAYQLYTITNGTCGQITTVMQKAAEARQAGKAQSRAFLATPSGLAMEAFVEYAYGYAAATGTNPSQAINKLIATCQADPSTMKMKFDDAVRKGQ